MSDFIKAEKVVRLALGLLEREVVLPNLVWRDAAGDFAGAKGDTITVRLPAYGVAKTRALRSGAPRVKSALYERAIDTKLDTDVYMDVPISDEELTLDIEDFGAQVLNPVVAAVGRSLEDVLIGKIKGATYAKSIAVDEAKMKDTILEARELLNKARVPAADRTLLIGSGLDTAILKTDDFVRFDATGNAGAATSALQDAAIGKLYGFRVVTSNEIAPGEAFAFHKTAYVLNQRAPIIPAGAPWGASQSYAGLAIRTVRVFDPDEVEDRFIADAWAGASIVTDQGSFDADGRWTPSEQPASDGSDTKFVRAIHLTAGA